MLFKLIFPLFFLFTAIAAEEYRTTECRDARNLPFIKPKKQPMPLPRPAPGEPVLLTIAAEVMSVSLDEYKNIFQANFTFRQEWEDPRLAFETIGEEEYRVIKDPASIWTPDLFFVNKKNGTSVNTIVKNYPDGRVLMSESKTVTAECPVNLLLYPFDTQICELKIESYGYTMDDIIILWNTTGNVSAETGRLLCPNHITSVTPYLDITTFRDVKYISPRLAFVLSRTASVILLRVLAPMIVIIACFWGSFTFTFEEMGMRVSLCVSPILTYMMQINFCIAFFISPSYLVSLDVWAATSAFAMSLSIIECIYIFYKKHPEESLFKRVSKETLIKKRIKIMLIVSGLDILSITSVFLTRLL